MKLTLSIVLLSAILVASVSAQKPAAGVVAFILIFCALSIDLSTYFAWKMHKNYESLPLDKKYMTAPVWIMAFLAWFCCGCIGCGVMYLFVKSEQDRIKMILATNSSTATAQPIDMVKVEEY